MPYRKKYAKRKPRRKRAPRKKSYRTQYTPVQRGVFSPRQLVTFKYRAQASLNAGIVAGAYHTFALTGLYDPDITGAGHQPLGFDEWMSFYNHYTVVGAVIKATFATTTGSGSLGLANAGITIAAGTIPVSTNPDSMPEQDNTTYRTLTNSAAKAVTTVTRKVSIKKFLGVRDLIDEDNHAGTAAANPTENVYALVWVTPFNSAYDPDPVLVSVELTFTALLHERKQLVQS